MIAVRVRDQDALYVLNVVAVIPQAGNQSVPGLTGRPSRVDEGDAPATGEDVGQCVARASRPGKGQ